MCLSTATYILQPARRHNGQRSPLHVGQVNQEIVPTLIIKLKEWKRKAPHRSSMLPVRRRKENKSQRCGWGSCQVKGSRVGKLIYGHQWDSSLCGEDCGVWTCPGPVTSDGRGVCFRPERWPWTLKRIWFDRGSGLHTQRLGCAFKEQLNSPIYTSNKRRGILNVSGLLFPYTAIVFSLSSIRTTRCRHKVTKQVILTGPVSVKWRVTVVVAC